MESLPKNLSFAMPILTCVRWHDAVCCSPQDCAGRSLPQRRPAVVRESSLASSAGCCPNSRQQPENVKTDKKCTYFVGCCNYLYYFWTKRSVKRDVNRVAVIVNVGNLLLDSNKRMSPSGRYYAPIGWSTSKRTAP